jgi:ubiquinone/menaquinone biosynthesis C-methylase UbiE
LPNIELVLGTETDTRLPDGSIDLAIMVDVYHELAQPQAFLKSVRRALQKDGRLALIEFRKEDRASRSATSTCSRGSRSSSSADRRALRPCDRLRRLVGRW